MKRRQFEEILDECISAYLSGRRSVEHSLSLYPSIARELEPLLRAAADTADTLQDLQPPPHVQERIRQRIVQAANERAAARALTRDIDGFTERRRHNYWLIALPAAAAAFAAIAVAGVVLLADMSDDPAARPVSVSVIERPEFDEARKQLDALQVKAARGENVTRADLDALVGATLRLTETAEPDQLPASDQTQVEEMIEDQLTLLDQLSDDGDEDEVDEAVAVTVSLAAALGVPVPDLGAAGTVTPATTARAQPTASTSTMPPTPTPTPASPLTPTVSN